MCKFRSILNALRWTRRDGVYEGHVYTGLFPRALRKENGVQAGLGEGYIQRVPFLIV